MTHAQALVWNLYAERLELLVRGQSSDFEHGRTPMNISMFPPTSRQVEIAQVALDATAKRAQLDIIHKALSPVVAAIDAIDNSHSKNSTVKECRRGIEKAYNALHALKAELEAKPESER